MIVFEKFGQHQPLKRQAERYALEGAPIALSMMADAVGAVCTALEPLRRLVEAHVLAAERLHGDDTTVPHRKAVGLPCGRSLSDSGKQSSRVRPRDGRA